MKVLFIASLLSSFLLADAQKIIEDFEKADVCIATVPTKYTHGGSLSKTIFPRRDASKIQNYCTAEEIAVLSTMSECLSLKFCQWAPKMNQFIQIGLADPTNSVETIPLLSLESCMEHATDVLRQSSSCQKAFF